MKALLSLLGIMMLCALLGSMKINLGEKNMGGIMNLIGTLCICMVVITPIVQSIVKLTGSFKALLRLCWHVFPFWWVL
ncbi:MAG: hypothetical protein ACLSCV_09695 [Acutalibacteraceae bacterium]